MRPQWALEQDEPVHRRLDAHMRTTPRALALAVLAILAVPAGALAAPDRTYSLNSSSPQAEWSGTGTGAIAIATDGVVDQCTDVLDDCDDTLVKIDSFGEITLGLTGTEPTVVDIDLFLIESNEAGDALKVYKASTSPSAVEQITTEVEPGYYLVRVHYYSAAGGFDATAKWTPLAPVVDPSVTPPVTTDPPPAAANTPPKSSITMRSRKVRSKSLKSFVGSAADDTAVARVEIGLLQKKGSKCKQLTRSGSLKSSKCNEPTTWLAAKGTGRWSFKLRKRLAKGKYVLFSRAIDDKGAIEAGFGSANRKTFTVS